MSGTEAENPKFHVLSVPILNDCVSPPISMLTVCSASARWYAPVKSICGSSEARVSFLARSSRVISMSAILMTGLSCNAMRRHSLRDSTTVLPAAAIVAAESTATAVSAIGSSVTTTGRGSCAAAAAAVSTHSAEGMYLVRYFIYLWLSACLFVCWGGCRQR